MRLIADENISWRLKKLIPQWKIQPSNEIKPEKQLTDLMNLEICQSTSVYNTNI